MLALVFFSSSSLIANMATTYVYTQTYRYNAIDKFVTKARVAQVYSTTQPHAVRSLSDGSSFQYDANDNMTQRTEMSGTQLVIYQQLGSTHLTTNITGTKVSEMRYYPFGETRYSSGSLPSDRKFIGQKAENVGVVGNMIDYGARFYSPVLGRFISADSIGLIAGNPQIYNRYAYAANYPLNHTDSRGHCLDDVCNNSTVSHVIYTSGYIGQRQYIINKYSLRSDIVTPDLVAQVMEVSAKFKLPAQLLAGSMYAEMNSYNWFDTIQDNGVAAIYSLYITRRKPSGYSRVGPINSGVNNDMAESQFRPC